MTKAIALIKDNYLIITILCVAAALRFYHLDYQSVWLDELHTLNEANPSYTFSGVYDEVVAGEQMPPLYFFIIHILFKLFGYTPLVLRTFSAVIGVLGVGAIYFLGKEIHNRKAGLLAAALTSVNSFHIYFSQEGRPYALLFLLTVCSFYFLFRFIKSPSLKSSLLYGFFAGLILYGHFFALFTLVAQAIILLYYIYRPFGVTSKKFFSYCIISGIVVIVLFSPCIPIILALNKTTSFWIPPATADTYLNIFKDFFGHSKIIIYTMLALVIAYFGFLARKKDDLGTGFMMQKYRTGVFILTTWFVITVLLPAIRSYLSVPMIISRYFVNILPVVLIMAAIVLASIKNNIARLAILLFIVVFSLKNIIHDKQYYTAISKSQFREVTTFIKEKNTQKAPVVTTLHWHYKYFFDDVTQQQVVGNTLDEYIGRMKQDAGLIKPFWYTNAHSNYFNINDENKAFLNEHFDLYKKVILFDAWANYYEPKASSEINNQDNIQPEVIPPARVLKSFDLSLFRNVTSKNNSGLVFHSNGSAFSPDLKLQEGSYKLSVKGISYPFQPLNGENAHFRVRMNGNEIGEFYLNEKGSEAQVPFELKKPMLVFFEIIYDNDDMINNIDRNGIIHSVEITAD